MYMKIAIASDHAGLEMKERIKNFLKKLGHELKDFGTKGEKLTEHPEFALKVANAVSKKECEKGILFCRTGLGMSIIINKVPGAKAILCYDVKTAKSSKDYNILTIGSKIIEDIEKAKEIINVWLE